jgi:hypothetical protein
MTEKTTFLLDQQMNERSWHSITKHQRGSKILTGAALGLWLVAMVGSLFLVWSYFVMYLPKETEILRRLDAEVLAADAQGVPFSKSDKAQAGQRQIMFVMTRVVGIGMVATAACVAVLSAAMLATIVLVIWNRRVTLRQISADLTQISAQLKALATPGRTGT